MKRSLTILILVAILLSIFAIPAGALGPTRTYLVISKIGRLPVGVAANIRASGGTIVRSVPQIGMMVVRSNATNFRSLASQKLAGAVNVVPNIRLQWIPPMKTVAFDPEFSSPPFSGDDDFYFDLQWGHDAVDAPEAWNLGYRGAGVRVAVLDTGFDLDHPDLAPNINMALSKDFTGEGLSYAQPDPFSHGTHTAGTIAAADNAFGTIGVAPEAELVLVKVLTDAGSGTFADVNAGIVYAADAGADVISMSLGAVLDKNGFCDADGCVTADEVEALIKTIKRATDYAIKKGSTIIASAGNDAIDFDGNGNLIHVPSGLEKVISISATAPIGWATDPANIFLSNLASYSNFGKSAVDFGAPGGDFIYPGNEFCTVVLTRPCWVFDLVFSTGSNLNPAIASFYWSAGTSMAAPHAAGVAAIIIGKNGGSMKPSKVEEALRKSALDLGKKGKDAFYGFGLVNAYQAVK
jgi:subtilisin family serine protease